MTRDVQQVLRGALDQRDQLATHLFGIRRLAADVSERSVCMSGRPPIRSTARRCQAVVAPPVRSPDHRASWAGPTRYPLTGRNALREQRARVQESPRKLAGFPVPWRPATGAIVTTAWRCGSELELVERAVVRWAGNRIRSGVL